MASARSGAPSADAVEWVKRLIAFDTTSRSSNLALIECVREYCESQGTSCVLTHNEDGSKANLFATLPGVHGRTTGGLILSGHTDVVPVDGQSWSSNPFVPEVRDGRLYGRGACDMKGFLGVALALLPTFREIKLQSPVHLALSYDEEVGCLGAPAMIADIAERQVNPTGCIVGEPTGMIPMFAHKATRLLRCRVKGKACHSSRTHEGVNAIYYAARIICFIQEKADLLQAEGQRIFGFDPPFTTMSVGQIKGGTAPNIVAEHCEFSFEYRSLPGEDPDLLEEEVRHFVEKVIVPEMAAKDLETHATLERLAAVPALAGEADGALARLVSELAEARPGKVAYCTEAGQFELASVPAVVWGPGSIEQAHKADEWVSLSQLERCEKLLLKAVSSTSPIY